MSRFDDGPNPWTPGCVVDPAEPKPNWWERNRIRATVFALIFLLAVLAFVVPGSLSHG